MRTRNSSSSAMDPQQIQDPDEKEQAATTTPSHADAVDLSDDIVAPAVHLPEAGGRRPATNRKKKAARKLAAGQKKMEALRHCLRPVPFSPGNPLSHFAKHERLFRRLGLWGFATLDFDRDLRADYLASLVSWYDPSTRSSSVADVRIKVSRADLALALRLPLKKERNPAEALEPEVAADAGVPDDLLAVKDFIMNCIFVNAEDALVIPDEITGAIRLLDAGEPEKIDWAGLVWSMAEKELSRGPAISNCYYASHCQMLIRSQRPELFEMAEKPGAHASTPASDSVPAAIPTATEATTVDEVEEAKIDDADENEGGEEEAKTGSQESELNEVLNEENEMVVEEVGDEQGEQGSLRPFSFPLFKDVPGGGGVVLTSDELTKRLLEREEEERAFLMQWVVEEVNGFGDEWTAKFSILQRDVYRMDDRLTILESMFQLLKSRPSKADVGGAIPPSN